MADYLNRLARIGALILCLALLSGCSMMRLGYGHLDTYAAWKASQYFDLDAQQKDEFQRRFDALHEWHRHQELPDYAAFLATARARLDGSLRPQDVDWFVDGVRARYARLVNRALDDAVALLYTLTPAQLEALRRQWDKDNRRFAREYRLAGSVEDVKRARARRTIEQIREWVGPLTREQEHVVVAATDAMPMVEKLRYEDRVRRQREFLRLMEQRGEDRKAFSEKLRKWLIEWDKGRNPEYERLARIVYARRVQLVIELGHALEPHQRALALGKLHDYIEDFTRLAQRPHSRAAVN